ncbi:MAG: DUF2283 domain-containing protein [bacterium]
MNKSNMFRMFYDSEADVLYVTKGHPEYTDYVEYGDNIILRFAPQTKELVGFTITDFSLSFARKDTDFQLPLIVNFEVEKSLLSATTE